MSLAHIEQFYAKAIKSQPLIDKMLKGTKSPEDFIRNAVSEGKSQGYDFTYEEAHAWIEQQQRMKASGELSDSQLEAVAGGKGSAGNAASAVGNAVGTVAQDVGNAVGSAANATAHAVGGAVNSIGSWLSSW
jgi:hypothetical protein